MLRIACVATYLVLSCIGAAQTRAIEVDRCLAPSSTSRLAYTVFWPALLPVALASPHAC